MIYPYLRIKQQQAELAVEFQDALRTNSGGARRLAGAEITEREWYKEQLSGLKREVLNDNADKIGPVASPT